MPPDRIGLGFDTSAAHCAAAVVCGDRVLAERFAPMETGQAERLMPLLAEVLAEAGIRYRDLGVLGVGTGPGNFTGVRIAVAAARGLALGLGVPAVGVTGFEALALGLPPGVLVAIDARRGAAWLGGAARAPVQTLLPDGDGSGSGDWPTDWSMDGAACDVTGHRAAEIAALTGGRALPPAQPLAVAIARIAVARAEAPGRRPAPLYLRAADASPPADPPPRILAG